MTRCIEMPFRQRLQNFWVMQLLLKKFIKKQVYREWSYLGASPALVFEEPEEPLVSWITSSLFTNVYKKRLVYTYLQKIIKDITNKIHSVFIILISSVFSSILISHKFTPNGIISTSWQRNSFHTQVTVNQLCKFTVCCATKKSVNWVNVNCVRFCGRECLCISFTLLGVTAFHVAYMSFWKPKNKMEHKGLTAKIF